MDKGSFSAPSQVVDLSGYGTLEVVRIGGLAVSRMTFLPGWRWSAHVRPIVGGTSCQTFHHGFVMSGQITVRMDDGSEADFAAGDIWVIPPGHDAWVVGDEPVVALEFPPPASQSR